MNNLFDTAFSPINNSFGLVKCDKSLIAEEFIKWQTPLISKYNNSFIKKNLHLNLAQTLLSLCPLTTIERRKYLLIPTKNSDWTFFFDNGHMGTDNSALDVLSDLLKKPVTYISYRPESGEIVWGYSFFSDNIKNDRSIALTKENKWTFYQYGNPLPFEDIEEYRNKNIKQRFSIELLDKYLQHIEIDLFNNEFMQPKAGSILISKEGPKFSNTQELSLTQAKDFFKH